MFGEMKEAIEAGKDCMNDEIEVSLFNMARGYYLDTEDELTTYTKKGKPITVKSRRKRFIPANRQAAEYLDKRRRMQKNIDDGKIKVVSVSLEGFLDEMGE